MSADKQGLSGRIGVTATDKQEITVDVNDDSVDANVKATRSTVVTVRADGANTGSDFGPNPVVSTSIYAAGDQMTDGFFLQNVFRKTGGTAVLQSVMVADSCAQNAGIDFFFLSLADFTSVESLTSLDNGTVTISASQFNNVLAGVWQVGASDYRAFGTGKSVACPNQPPLVLQGSSATYLFVLPVVRTTPTYSSSGALTFRFGFLQD